MAAFNAGEFRRNVEGNKNCRMGADAAQCDGVYAQNSEQSGVIVDLGEAGKLLVLPGSCLRAFVCCPEPNWRRILPKKEAAGSMVRERMPCRRGRGSGRGSSSRSPAADTHHHCCCCYCHRRVGASPVQASQFVEAGGSNNGEPRLPAFGSVIFTLGNSRDNAGINAHISVLFTRVPEENVEGLPRPLAVENPMENEGGIQQSLAGEILSEHGGRRQQSLAEEIRVVDKGKRPLGEASSSGGTSLLEPHQISSHAREPELPAFMDGLPEGQGWAWIREAEPEEDEPEEAATED